MAEDKVYTKEEVRQLMWDARLFYSKHPYLPYRHLRPLFREWFNEKIKEPIILPVTLKDLQ